jgi:uncharacterized membrane protein YedE/YeeE
MISKQRLIFIGIGVVLGAIAGYLYYYYIGCASGSCAITSKPLNSTLYGSVMGGLALDMVNDWKKKDRKEEQE